MNVFVIGFKCLYYENNNIFKVLYYEKGKMMWNVVEIRMYCLNFIWGVIIGYYFFVKLVKWFVIVKYFLLLFIKVVNWRYLNYWNNEIIV